MSFVTRLTFPLQAWRKYDTDRSGYIEANELKVGRVLETVQSYVPRSHPKAFMLIPQVWRG